MATHYNLEEQEQISQIKHFWGKYGNPIVWVLIVALAGFAAWMGWQHLQRQSAQEASVLFEQLEQAAQANDTEQFTRIWADMQQNAGKVAQTHHAALLVARHFNDAGQPEPAQAALQWALNQTEDEVLQSALRLRLSALDLQAQRPAEALAWLETGIVPEFQALAQDRRGDILLAQGQTDAARLAYRQAWEALPADQDYRRIVEAKLNALGVDPSAPANQESGS